MERILSDEEKLRRAIEISQRRSMNNTRSTTTTRVNVNEKKDYKLFKKMILQIIICLLIYIIFHLINTTNYVFSADIIKNTNEILNYDINFPELYNNLMLYITPKTDENKDVEQNNIENNIKPENNTLQNSEQIVENNITENNNSVETENVIKEETKSEETQTLENEKEEKQEEPKEKETAKTQMEKDAETVSKLCKFGKPLNGTITSEFGAREATIDGMTTDHKGIDIATNSGTSIKAVMAGTVSVAEEDDEYGKFIKIVNGDIITVYAHCQKLKVKVGDKIKIGQTIATVGSTGTSTGPHLHLEIRFKNRYINPRLLIEF